MNAKGHRQNLYENAKSRRSMENINLNELKSTLEKLGYTVSLFENKEKAADYLNGQIDATSVGFGGSVSLKEMNLYEKLASHNKVFWHNYPIPEGMTAADVIKAASQAELYISSVNGLAMTGEIINIDGRCNRVSETLYGHKKVYFVVGKNKIAPDYDSALFRARNIAAPKNAQRLKLKTPCAVKGDKCYNCKSPDRICNALTVFWSKPYGSQYEILLVDENLGY